MITTLAAMVLAVSPVAAQDALQKPGHFPPIAQILGSAEPPTVRPGEFDRFIGRLHAPDPEARKNAAAALGYPGNVRAVPYLGAIVLQLNEKPEVRVAAAMALGRVRNWRADTFLRQSLRDSVREVRFASALALGKTKTPEATDLLVSALAADEDWWVRFAAAVALGENRDPKSTAALARAADVEPEWQVRMQAVRSLGQQGSRDAAKALGKPLRDTDASVRAATAMALAEIGGVESLHLLAEALHEENEEFPRQVMSDSIKKLLSKP